ncbi:hypothetical protein [Acidicapsa acidisoli]|uniref:hypothetical protein n=1 Tax=Acidicapsa acidisoli TaxID=1615681 RepID=UPI0021DFAF69|nr:hypothetical protein [Acidicapsa acidisoli]
MASGEDRQSAKSNQPDLRTPRYLLVMTATIIPAANAGVRRADPQLRLEDYKQALRYWLNYDHPAAERILLLENSGADLAELRAIAADENPHGKAVEILSVPGNRIPEGTNYGYTEMQMLDEGLAQSQLRQQTTHIIKVTGRLTFPAIGKALDKIGEPFELMAECRKLGFPRRGFDASTQLFVCSHDFYDHVLRDSKREMNSTDVRLLEHLIYRKIIPFKGQPGIYLRFPINIEPVGYSGFKSRSYRSPKTALTRAIRAALRVIAPNYWF